MVSCARSTRAFEDRPGYPVEKRPGRVWKGYLIGLVGHEA